MRIGVDISSLKRSRWTDYATRFVCGGMVTALTGLPAKRYGPGVAGLLLAFPAIFPAGATLIEKHEKREAHFDGTSRGRAATSIDAAGAAIGSLGLIAFAVTIWRFLPKYSSLAVLTAAGLAWLLVGSSKDIARAGRVNTLREK